MCSKVEVAKMSIFEVSHKRPMNCDENRWNHSIPSRFKRPKLYKTHDSSSRYDFSKKGQPVPSRFQDHSLNSSRNQFHKPSRDFSRNCDVTSPRYENPCFDYSRNDCFNEGTTQEMNSTRDFSRNRVSVSPRFQARNIEIDRGPVSNLIPNVHFTQKCDSKEGVIRKVNEKHDLSRKLDLVSPRPQKRPSENPKEDIVTKENEKHDLSRKCDSVSPRLQERPSENNKSEAASPEIELKTSENSKEGPLQVEAKSGEITVKVKPSENLVPSVANSESTMLMVSRDNFKRRKVDAVREFPKHCGALAPRVKVKAFETRGEVNNSEALMPSVVNSDSTNSIISRDNFKKRKVNAVRQFPRHCGALAPRVTIRRLDDNSIVIEEDTFESSKISSSSIATPVNTYSKLVSETIEAIDMEKASNEIKGDDVENALNESVMSNESADSSNTYECFSQKKAYASIEDDSPKRGIVNHAFNPKGDIQSDLEDRNQCEDSFKRNFEENDLEEEFDKVQSESTQAILDISSESEDEDRNKMGKRPIYSPDVELSPFKERCKEACSEDDECINDSDLLSNQNKVGTSYEYRDEEDINKMGNSPIYLSDIELSSFEEHEESSSEDDCYIVNSKYSDLFPNQDKMGPFGDSEAVCKRKQVMETLDSYQQILAGLSEKCKAAKSNGKRKVSMQVHLDVAMLLKKEKQWVNTEELLGHVPGVEIGDKFQFRAELVCIGLHRQFQGGIDYMKKDGRILATSIVSSGRYHNSAEFSDMLRYSGQGGNPNVGKDKQPQDQKLVRGNLALKNSMDAKTPVRVIRKSTKSDFTYFYDGLYLVTKVTQERSHFGKLVYMFELNRIKSGEAKVTQEKKLARVVEDISHGKEKIPIRIVNTVDDVDFPSFNYISKMTYPESCYRYIFGCDCSNGCSDSKHCRCVVKNGGESPFSDDGSIIITPRSKKFIYECGPSCNCPPSCKNRVSQYGIKYQLEVFKTESRGWGLRSRNYIPAGSFICEYVGELLHDQEAEKRTGNDEYLFDIGNNGFTIDAAKYGNVGRFINHSCSPNLYAQNVLYDHGNKKMAHVMFFAVNGIFPLQELTYDYNYKLDQVRDGNGNIKKKACRCGSSSCRGRLY